MTGATMTQPTIPADQVEKARAELREHIDDLTTIAHHKVERDDGTITHATTAPLLEQVDAEIVQQSAPSGSFNPRSRPPLWLEAVDYFTTIDAATSGMDGDTRCARVRAWSAHYSSQGTPIEVIDARDFAALWLNGARVLLDPRRRQQMWGEACPECKETKVWSRNDEGAGESHYKPALQVDSEAYECRCKACDTSWNFDRWELLRDVLEQQRHETLAATGMGPAKARTISESGRTWFDADSDALPLYPAHAERMNPHPSFTQCRETAQIGDAKPRRCTRLLDMDGYCPGDEYHVRRSEHEDQ